MAFQMAVLPVLVIIAVVFSVIVYMKTKSWSKVSSAFQIIFALSVFGLITQIADSTLIAITVLLGLGMLINGIIGLK